MHAASDRELALQVRRGEDEAFGELVRRYQTSVFNVCYRMLGERREAEDFTQEAFIRAYDRFDSFNVKRPFGPWIQRIAANLCLNSMQRVSPPHFHLEEERDLPLERPARNPEALAEQGELAEQVRQAILDLPGHYRTVIELRHFQDMNYDEIAQALGLSLSEVKTHLYRARRALADRLSPDD